MRHLTFLHRLSIEQARSGHKIITNVLYFYFFYTQSAVQCDTCTFLDSLTQAGQRFKRWETNKTVCHFLYAFQQSPFFYGCRAGEGTGAFNATRHDTIALSSSILLIGGGEIEWNNFELFYWPTGRKLARRNGPAVAVGTGDDDDGHAQQQGDAACTMHDASDAMRWWPRTAMVLDCIAANV